METTNKPALKNRRTHEFKEMFERLPTKVQELGKLVFLEFLRDPNSPALSNHPLRETHRGRHRKGTRAVSITQKYRALYVEEPDRNLWYWVGSHNDYENFTGSN